MPRATSQSAQITVAGDPLEWRPHDCRRIFVTVAIRSGLPPHIAAKICVHAALDTTMGYAAIYPEEVISHHRAFIARRRTERPSEEYRELAATCLTSQGRHSHQRHLRSSTICRAASGRISQKVMDTGWTSALSMSHPETT
ncbi:hypothetical protein [Streptomyces sp. NPDC023838]|uniref:hypothetical protein n=1 Tax=Streptomyces sp. NPDC023838 TaxID=3154325 RepID=UPI0033D9EB64